MKILTLQLVTKKRFPKHVGELFRGYIGNLFIDDIDFHNHVSGGGVRYKTPTIQYKVLNGYLSIVAMKDSIDLLKRKLDDLDRVKIGEIYYEILEKIIYEEELDLQINDSLYEYHFDYFWLALNEKNYKKYKNNELSLDNIIIGNILEFFKLNNIFVKNKIMIKGVYQSNSIIHKKTKLIGFTGKFITNVKLPNNLGLGKRKSIGFGTLIRNN